MPPKTPPVGGFSQKQPPLAFDGNSPGKSRRIGLGPPDWRVDVATPDVVSDQLSLRRETLSD